MTGFRSYTKEDIQAAIDAGKEVWALDTGNDGDDDHLIGSEAEVIRAICDFHEIEELKEHWALDKVDWDVQ